MQCAGEVPGDLSASTGVCAVKPTGTFPAVDLLVLPMVSPSEAVNVEIDLTSYSSGQGTVTVDGYPGTLTLDGDAVSGFAGKSVKLGIGRADISGMNDDQKPIALKYDVLDIGAESDGTAVHEPSGKVTVKVPYSLKDGEDASDVVLYYMDSAGNVQAVGGTYAAGTLTAEPDHLSYYFASGSYSESKADTSIDEESMIRLSIGTAVAMFILTAGIVVAFIRRR